MLVLLNMVRDVKAEYKVLKEKVKEYNKRDAKFYGNMFAKWRKVDYMEANVSKSSSSQSFCWYIGYKSLGLKFCLNLFKSRNKP
jgi:uncharacterized metal-binding protein